MSPVASWRLRAEFAARLSDMYGREVPAYATLLQVAHEVNADVVASRGEHAERLGSLARVTAERHGAVRLGTATELAQVATVFAAMGMHPVGFYDLREAASPVPVVSTAFRPVEPGELARNPFRVFTSVLTPADRRFFSPDLHDRLESFLADRELFGEELLDLASRAEASPGARGGRRRTVPHPGRGGLRAVDGAGRPGLVRRAGGGERRRRGHRRREEHPRQPPDAAGSGHRRPVRPDGRPGHHDDRRHPGPARVGGTRRAAAADVVPRPGRTSPVPAARRVGVAR